MIRFADFELQPDSRRLLRGGAPLPVGSRAFDVLCTLIERRDRIVGKDELLDAAWPGVVVEENNLPVQIGQLRKVIGADAIATVPGRGYRFILPVETGASAERAPAVAAAENVLAPTRRPGNLPPSAPVLFGRDAAIEVVRAMVSSQRLVSIVGAGGIGKSSLAQAVSLALADHWSDGAWTVELAGLGDPHRVPQAVAQALAISLRGDSPLEELVDELAPRSLLLVLDNCEHLVDAVAALAHAILQRAPGIFLLTTTQEPLHLSGEQQYRVAPLDMPASGVARDARGFAAVRLFETRLRAAARQFVMSDASLCLIVDICRGLDGLPLAIELAAARAATLGLGAVRDHLGERLRLLTGGARSALPRHQTLRAALDWSFSLLDGNEQAVFSRLGLCVGGFNLELAQAVGGDAQLEPLGVLDHLASLVDKSLVMVEGEHVPRYRLLESARAFALEQLDGAERAAAAERHARAVAVLFARADDANRDGDLRSETHDALLLPEIGNLRAAYAWASGPDGDTDVALTLAACAAAIDDFGVECVDWLLALRPIVERDGLEGESAARFWRAVAASTMNGRIARALQADAARRAATLYRKLDKPRRVYSALIQLAKHSTARGENEVARQAADEAHALECADWPAMLRVHLLRVDGYLARDVGDFAGALVIFREAVRLSALTQDWLLEVIARANLADLLWQVGPLDEAASVSQALADALRERPASDLDQSMVLSNLMGILCELGRFEEAAAIGREALPQMRRSKTYYLEHWAYLFGCRGQRETAKALLGAAESERRRQARSERDERRAAMGVVVGVPTLPGYNETRIVAKLRASLGAPGEAGDAEVAAGSALREPEWLVLISRALEAPALA